MGEIVAAALVSHQPLIMMPLDARVALGGTGADTTLIEPGFRLLREHLGEMKADMLVIIDTHWATTVESAIAGAALFQGLYTSEEMPRTIFEHPYDYPGAPELAAELYTIARARKLPMANVTTPTLHPQYPTINLVHHMRTNEKVLTMSVVQTGGLDDYLALGAALRDAIAAVPGRVAILATGGMSHAFWPLTELPKRLGFDDSNIVSEQSRAFDHAILDRWAHGDHVSVVERYPEYRAVKPEGRFGHYLIMLGALGGSTCTAIGTPFSKYENAVGTGQVHVVFDLRPLIDPTTAPLEGISL